jgi:hypothetical protein
MFDFLYIQGTFFLRRSSIIGAVRVVFALPEKQAYRVAGLHHDA